MKIDFSLVPRGALEQELCQSWFLLDIMENLTNTGNSFLEQVSIRMHQNHLEDLLKQTAGPTPSF